MPRNNKVTGRVFAEIAETSRRKGAYEGFLAIDQKNGFQESETLKKIKEDYKVLVNDMAANIKVLASLEEIITQIRAKEAIDTELRLSLSRNYIYARTSFYRKDNKINDIRVVVGKVHEYGDKLDELLRDTNFRTLCKEKLNEVMDKEINNNITNLNLVQVNEQ
jgi:hypothetical protein